MRNSMGEKLTLENDNADYTVLVAETRSQIQHIVSEFERACDCMGLKINAGKSKVLVVKKNQMGSCEIVRESGEEMQEVGKFNYLEVMVNTDGGMEDEVTHRELEERKIWITMEREHDIQRSKTGVI